MSGSLAIQSNPAAYTPGTVDFQETMAVAQATLKDAYQLLTVSFLGPQAVEVPGATRLEPPKKLSMDANLLLAQLQDTLNQLLQKVSVNDIKQNLQTQNEANKKQLETMQEAAKAASAAAAKAKETEHKLNVWKAVANWVGVAITAASIAFTVIAALGQLAVGNVVSSAAADEPQPAPETMARQPGQAEKAPLEQRVAQGEANYDFKGPHRSSFAE